MLGAAEENVIGKELLVSREVRGQGVTQLQASLIVLAVGGL